MDEINEEVLTINEEELDGLSAEELVDLKIELNDLLAKVDDLIAQCDEKL